MCSVDDTIAVIAFSKVDFKGYTFSGILKFFDVTTGQLVHEYEIEYPDNVVVTCE